MTEDEAKTKWCPFSRVILYNEKSGKGGAGHNRAAFAGDARSSDEELNPTFCRCIGSACMAWRGTYQFQGNRTVHMEDGSGYCGLAGRP